MRERITGRVERKLVERKRGGGRALTITPAGAAALAAATIPQIVTIGAR